MPQELLEDQDTWSISAIRFLRQHSHDVASYRAPSTTCIWPSRARAVIRVVQPHEKITEDHFLMTVRGPQ